MNLIFILPQTIIRVAVTQKSLWPNFPSISSLVYKAGRICENLSLKNTSLEETSVLQHSLFAHSLQCKANRKQTEAPICCYSLSNFSQKQREEIRRKGLMISIHSTAGVWSIVTMEQMPPPKHDAFQSTWPQAPTTGTWSLTDTEGKKKGCFTGTAKARAAPSFHPCLLSCLPVVLCSITNRKWDGKWLSEVLSCSGLPLVTFL